MCDALRLPLASVSLQEARLFAQDASVYVVLDLLPPPDDAAAAATAINKTDEAVLALEQLVCCSASPQPGVLGRADPAAGVERIGLDEGDDLSLIHI